MAVAGFGSMELVLEQNWLTIRGKRRGSDGKTYLHRGIATRACVHHFDLADYVEVTDAAMGEGLLVISLRRELPEALKLRAIPINAGTVVPLGRKPSGGVEHRCDTDRPA